MKSNNPKVRNISQLVLMVYLDKFHKRGLGETCYYENEKHHLPFNFISKKKSGFNSYSNENVQKMKCRFHDKCNHYGSVT